MKKYYKLLLAGLLILSCLNLNGQVLISLLLGDKLNSDKLEFGADGGIASTNLFGESASDFRQTFFLGFYFDIKLSESAFIHTGIIVKSPMGAKEINPHTLGEKVLDSLFSGGEVERKLTYFSLPIFLKYKFKSNLFFVFGPQIGFLLDGEDTFNATNLKGGSISYTNSITDQLNRWDFGLTAGMGYKLLDGKGINLGLRYYYGVLNIAKSSLSSSAYNQGFYLFAGIPIGGIKE